MLAALFVLFFLVMRSANWRAAAMLGFVFGIAFFGIGLRWIYGALGGYIGLPIPAAFVIAALFFALLSLFPAAAMAAGRQVGGWSVAGFWALAEWIRGWLFGGFPWLAIGYSQTPEGLLAGWLPVVGVDGLNLLLALFCLAPALALHSFIKKSKGRLQTAAVAVAAMIFIAGGGAMSAAHAWSEKSGDITVSLLQGNVKQDLKWREGEVQKALADYARMAAAAEGELVALPETAIPMRRRDMPASFLQVMQNATRQKTIVAGMFVEEDGALYNAAAMFGEDADGVYRKQHLTPYGEYLPLAPLLRPLLLAADIPYNSLAAGDGQKPMSFGEWSAAISICYEDIFGGEWRAQLPQAQMLLNLTNDGWFDGSAMAAQHRQMSQARAAEFGRWLARATNTGMTAMINHRGQVVAELPPETQGTLTGKMELRIGATPYVRHGSWPSVIAALLIAAAAALQHFHQRRLS